MHKTRTLLFASMVAGAMLFGGVVGATGLAKGILTAASAATASPSPSFESNETPSHETGESATQEAAENNGTFRPGGNGNGPSNETPSHEASESASHEAGEKT